MKLEKRRQTLFFVSLIGIITVILIMGTTYAYQTLQVEYENGSDNDLTINVGHLEVSYTKTNKINVSNITEMKDYKTADSVEFTVDNSLSTDDIAYQIKLTKLENVEYFNNKNFKYTITLTPENGIESIVGQGDFSNLTENSYTLDFNLGSYRVLSKGKKETLKLYLWLKENDEDLSSLENKSFKGYIEINSFFKTETNETIYSKLNIHGNSIQDTQSYGEISLENSVKIENLGTHKNIFDKDRWLKELLASDHASYPTTTGKDGEYEYIATYPVGHSTIPYMQGEFKPNTQYTLSYYGKEETASALTGFMIKYTDGTSGFLRIVNSDWTKYVYKSDANKTIDSIRIYYYQNALGYYSNIQIEEGTEATEYKPFDGKYEIPVSIKSKNLFDESLLLKTTTIKKTEAGYQVSAYPASFSIINGYDSGRAIVDHLKKVIKPNVKYTLSRKISNYVSASSGAIVLVDADSNTIASVTLGNGFKSNTFSLTQEQIDSITSVWVYGNTSEPTIFEYIQLEEGEVATEYEPYKENYYIYLDEPLRKVGNYSDYIDYKNGLIVRNIGTYNITGNENNWYENSVYTNDTIYTITADNLIKNLHSSETIGLMDKFIYANNSTTINSFRYSLGQHFFISFDKNVINNLESAKAAIKGSEAYYVLNTPKYESVDLPIINTSNKSETISCSKNKVCSSNIEIETNK